MPNETSHPAATAEMYDRLREFVARVRKTLDMCGKCCNAGLDADPEKKDCAEQIAVAEAMIREFFPNGRPAERKANRGRRERPAK